MPSSIKALSGWTSSAWRLPGCLWVCALLVAPAAQAAIPPTERAALVALYDATNGPGWVSSAGWLGAAGTECSWFGVTCDGTGSTVTVLDLHSNQLNGSLPAEVGDLLSLQGLYLFFNQLGGSIPAELGNLSALTDLWLSGNALTGSIPAELGNLSALSRLRLFSNQLSGSIPAELGNLTVLVDLGLNENQLSGSIPAELGNLVFLQSLELGGNQLSGSIPAELGNLAALVVFFAGDNQLSGSLPAEMGNLSSLQYLVLSSNQLSGSIPAEMGNLSALLVLYLDDNQLSGSLPAALGGLSSLTELRLFSNQLSGSIPPELGNLPSILAILLNDNLLSGSIPPELGSLSSLTDLFLESNQLSGNIPPELGNLSSLRQLNLDSNHLTGIPPELGNLPSIQLLTVNDNRLSGSIPPELGNLSTLQYLFLKSNRLGGSIPPQLDNLISLVGLNVSWNALHTSDPILKAFLDLLQPGWDLTQTIAPTNVTASSPTGGTVLVSWTPIPYTQDAGGYRVSIGTTLGGPYTLVGTTSSKTATSMAVAPLDCGSYYLVVETQTDPHADNANTVVSEQSAEASAATGLALSPQSLPGGRIGTPYSANITASGGVPPYTFAVTSGTLPPGLSLSSAGLLSGTPAAHGASTFTVTASDASCQGSRVYDLIIDAATDYIAGEGPGPSNTNRVRVYTPDGTATSVDFQAYGAGKWGTKVSSGDVDGGALWAILAGPGPGDVYGPQMRAFRADGTPIAKINFYAYGTLKFGVNPAAGLLDGDAYHEMLSGAGPGSVFGPHVRGWNFDAVAVTPIARINFFAYSTLKYGVNVEEGDVDGDLFAELLTGSGPGLTFGPQVRGWNHDGAVLSPMAKINFLPSYTPAEYGVQVAGGDVDADSFAEIATAPGPGPSLGARFLGFDYDGASISALPGFDITPFGTLFGGRLGLAELTGDGRWDLVVAAGPDPAADSRVEGHAYDGTSLSQIPAPFTPFGTPGYGYGTSVGGGMLGW